MRLRERMVGFAASQLARETAEDLAQEVLMLLHTKYAQVSELDELVPLSFQILRYKMHGTRRREFRRGEHNSADVTELPVADPRPNPAAELERRELLEQMERALAQLGGRCRELFRLKLEGRSFPEIQALMKANSINTVYTWDARCRKDLAERMSESRAAAPARKEARR
jgi:RNA polymerase sigma-70 factor, ECF subfamily